MDVYGTVNRVRDLCTLIKGFPKTVVFKRGKDFFTRKFKLHNPVKSKCVHVIFECIITREPYQLSLKICYIDVAHLALQSWPSPDCWVAAKQS